MYSINSKLTLKNTAENARSYLVFGMQIENRTFGDSVTAVGFQGQYKVNEVFGKGNYIDYTFRGYNTRLGRFFAVDPLARDYPWNSPYAFSENRVIDGIELEGLEWKGIHTVNSDGTVAIDYTVKIKVLNSSQTLSKAKAQAHAGNIAKRIETAFTGNNSQGVSITTKVELEFVDQVDEKDFFIEFVNGNVQGGSEETTGIVDKIGNTQSNRIQIRSDMNDVITAETGVHELGHTAGLRHEDDPKNPEDVLESMESDNIMNSVDFGNTKITDEQRGEIDQNIPSSIRPTINTTRRDNTLVNP